MDPIEEQEESLKRKEKKGDETVLSQFATAASSTNVITYKAQTNIVPWKCARKPVKNGRERESGEKKVAFLSPPKDLKRVFLCNHKIPQHTHLKGNLSSMDTLRNRNQLIILLNFHDF